jgi:hypothetical protein
VVWCSRLSGSRHRRQVGFDRRHGAYGRHQWSDAVLGADQGYTLLHGCNPESRGLTVYGTFDWANGPISEPATWALMLTGFGLAGAALRRLRTFAAACLTA